MKVNGLINTPMPALSSFDLVRLTNIVLDVLGNAERHDKVRLTLKIEARLKFIRSDRNKVAFILLSLIESAFADPLRNSKINITISTSVMPKKIFPASIELLCPINVISLDAEEHKTGDVSLGI